MADTNGKTTTTEKTPKKRGPKPKPKPPATELIKKPKKNNFPTTVELPEGDNTKYTTFALSIMKLPKIDICDPVQLSSRVAEYFQLCSDHDMKPGVAAVGLAIGLDRRRLWEIRTGVNKNLYIPQECKDIINSVYDSLEVLWEGYMANGKINPVSGIFLAKNNFGYQDKQEYVLTPNQSVTTIDPTTIEQKYAELPGGDSE